MEDDEQRLLTYIGGQVRRYRQARRLGQAAFEPDGVSRATIANLEAGRQNVTVGKLGAVAARLGVPVSALVPTVTGGDGPDLAWAVLAENAALRARMAEAAQLLRARDIGPQQ